MSRSDIRRARATMRRLESWEAALWDTTPALYNSGKFDEYRRVTAIRMLLCNLADRAMERVSIAQRRIDNPRWDLP